eukprot:COSAG06_NODE_9674_length_1846_cov_7.321122_2_plen_231_part_00
MPGTGREGRRARGPGLHAGKRGRRISYTGRARSTAGRRARAPRRGKVRQANQLYRPGREGDAREIVGTYCLCTRPASGRRGREGRGSAALRRASEQVRTAKRFSKSNTQHILPLTSKGNVRNAPLFAPRRTALLPTDALLPPQAPASRVSLNRCASPLVRHGSCTVLLDPSRRAKLQQLACERQPRSTSALCGLCESSWAWARTADRQLWEPKPGFRFPHAYVRPGGRYA